MEFADQYGPWALIAGASEGTGAAFARRIAREGLNCILLARRTGPLETLAQELRAEFGIECVTASIDLAAPEALERMKEVVGAREVGLFVSNAGADPNASGFFEKPTESWDQLIHLNVLTAMHACHHFGGLMRARRRGGILLVNSGACYGGGSGLAVYAGSKAFMLAFAEGLWAELRAFDVDVLTMVLGRTDTPAFRQWCADNKMPVPPDIATPEGVAEDAIGRLGQGPIRNWGQADDVAGMAPNSPDARRERILIIERAKAAMLAGADA